MKIGEKRTFYLDLARVIAIISITLNHAVNRTYQTYTDQLAEYLAIPFASTLLKVVVFIFSRMGVPLFLMITGVLIMNKKMEDASDVRKFYKHNVLSLFITAEIWYFLMYWYLVIGNNLVQTNGWLSVIGGMFSTMLFLNQTTMSSMWYIPMILCVYTTLPFVIMIKDKLTNSKAPFIFLPIILLFVIDMVMPSINSCLEILELKKLKTPISQSYLFCYYYIYILIGYLISRGSLKAWKTWVVTACAATSFLACCGYQLWVYTKPVDYVVPYDFMLLPFCVGFLFELVRRGAHLVQKAEKPITCISRISFGIYLMHILFVTALKGLLDRYAPGLLLPVRLMILEIIPVGLSIAIILPLSKIRLFKKYVFLIK